MKYGQYSQTEVDIAIDEFRDLLNDLSRIIQELLGSSDRWNTICSGMDVIGNTESAIKHYEGMPNPSDLGGIYLSVYGLLQSMVVQQESLRNVFRVLYGKFDEFEGEPLAGIRDLRNDCIGHPTKRDYGVEPRSNFFFSLHWSKEHFSLTRAYHGERPDESIEIYPLKLISEQRAVVARAIGQATETLKSMENEHRDKFKDKFLQKHLNGYGYLFEKVFNHFSLADSTRRFLAEKAFAELKANLEKFRSDLSERCLDNAYPGLEVALEEITYPEGRLAEYFSESSAIDPMDAKSFAVHFESRFVEIHEMAGEIDKEYQSRL